DVADLDAVDIRWDLDNAVRVMPRQVGVHAVTHDDLGLVRGRPGGDQQRRADAMQAFGRDAWHAVREPASGRRQRRVFGQLAFALVLSLGSVGPGLGDVR